MGSETPEKPEVVDFRSKTAAEWAESDFKEAKAVEFFKGHLEGMIHNLDGLQLGDAEVNDSCAWNLQYIGRAIELLKENYPNDPDIKLFEEMYSDLSEDFDHSTEVVIDSGYDAIVLAMQKELKEGGVREVNLGNPVPGKLGETVENLEKVGIVFEYVVTSGNLNAKTVILFMQAHSNPGADKAYLDAAGITDSQDGIYRDISQIVESGLGKLVYDEGGRIGEDVDFEEIGSEEETPDYAKVMAGFRLKRGLKDRVILTGAEPPGLVDSTVRRMQNEENPGKVFMYRAVAHNVLVANAVVDDLNRRSDGVGVLIFGAMHEKFPVVAGEKIEQPLSLSRCLAGMGVNVVVVDRADMTEEKLKKAMQSGGGKVVEKTFGLKSE